MSMAWISALMGGLQVGGGVLGNQMSLEGVKETNAANAQLAQQNRDWMSNLAATSMQTRASDLRAAGLNPMLAAGGPGATVPQTAPAVMQNPNAAYANLGSQLGGAASTALQTASTNAQVAQTQAQTDLTAAQAQIAQGQAPHAAAQAAANVAQTEQNTKTLKSDMYKLDSEFDLNTLGRTPLAMQDYSIRQELFPLQKQYQALDVQRQRLAMPALEADADFWKGLSPGAKTLLLGAKEAMTPIQQGSSAISNLARLPMME